MSGAAAGVASVAGTDLYYEAHGPVGAPAILLLHGFTLDRRMWRAQVAALADRFRVVAYDARGFGRSASPGPERYRHCEDAAALIEHLGVAPVVAVGHSIGGNQLLELAVTRPDLVRGFATIALSGLASVPFSDDLATLFATLRAVARAEGLAAAKALWARCGWFTPAREVPALAAALDEMLADYSGLHWTGDGRPAPLVPSAATRLGELRMPVMALVGARDLPYNHRATAALRAGVPHARVLELADVGHMAPMEAPAAVSAALAEFAAAVAAG